MSKQKTIRNAIFFGAEDIKIILGIENTKAYDIIKKLRKELVDNGYASYPAGKVPKKFFCERYYLELQDVEEVLQANAQKMQEAEVSKS